MSFALGDIYWAQPSGPVGHEQQGRRPFIVVSRSSANGRSVVAVPFTSDKDGTRPWPAYCIRIPAGQVIRDANCKSDIVDSIALCHQIRILDSSTLTTKMGRLNPTAIIAIQIGLAYLFDIR